jgi:isopentenyl diphosphate isomerase/L-lactate dehydrogenase-like FMN-dependent dehydrogenase
MTSKRVDRSFQTETRAKPAPPDGGAACGALDPVNVADFEEIARGRLEPGAYGYFAGGAGDEHTLRANVAAFARWELRPRVLVDVSEVSTAATVLGAELAMPLLVAPTAFQRLADPEGELATARAAAAAGTVMCLSTLSSVSPAELAAAAPGAPQWFQLYWSQDRGFTGELVAAVAEAGFRALVLTVDFPVAGRRERDLRAEFALPDDLPLPNLPVRLEREDFHRELGAIVDPALTWRDLEWLRSACDLPLVVKGVLTAEDALLAAEHGAAAVVVSNHGGRQLDGVPASLDVLPEVVDAVGEREEVLFDGGIRRGTDVLKALALGARATLAGRAMVWGLAAGGEEGVARVLALLRKEIEVGLKLLGCPSPADVTHAHVRKAGSPV